MVKTRLYTCLLCANRLETKTPLAYCPACQSEELTYKVVNSPPAHHTTDDGLVLYTANDLIKNRLMLGRNKQPLYIRRSILSVMENILDHYRIVDRGREAIAIDQDQLNAHNYERLKPKYNYRKLTKPKLITD